MDACAASISAPSAYGPIDDRKSGRYTGIHCLFYHERNVHADQRRSCSRRLQTRRPVLSANGVGTVDLGNRAIDIRIKPKATTIVAKTKFSVSVPFRIKGPWNHVHATADIGGIVNSVLDNLKSGKAPFKGLLTPSQLNDPNAPKKKHKSLGDAVKNMLGLH